MSHNNKKTIIEEAFLDVDRIQAALNSNAKEILRSVAIGEIESVVKESINEDLYDEEDVDTDTADDEAGDDVATDAPEADADDAGEEMPADDAEGAEGDDLDNLDMDGEEGGLEDYGAEEDGEDYEMDMTGASNDEVLAVYKKLSGDDEIEIVSDDEVIIKDPVSGAEYQVKFGGAAKDDLGAGLGDDMGAEGGLPLGDELGDEMGAEPEMGAELDLDNTEDDMEEGTVYEVALEDGEEMTEDIVRGKGHDKHLANGTMPSGDIEGTKAPQDTDSGDNLEGGFDDDAVKHANAEGPMVMGENEEELEEGEEMEDEAIEEAIPVGNAQGRRLPGKETPIKGAGAKSLEETTAKYEAVLAEAKQLKAENEAFKVSLNKLRGMLGEAVVFNTNLVNVTKLFTEHATTLSEKKQIIDRFDNEAKTIKESKKLYKTISTELTNKKPMVESVENKIIKENASSTSNQLIESTVYVDPSTQRIKDLMKRVEGR